MQAYNAFHCIALDQTGRAPNVVLGFIGGPASRCDTASFRQRPFDGRAGFNIPTEALLGGDPSHMAARFKTG
jgi:hypothetical protein